MLPSDPVASASSAAPSIGPPGTTNSKSSQTSRHALDCAQRHVEQDRGRMRPTPLREIRARMQVRAAVRLGGARVGSLGARIDSSLEVCCHLSSRRFRYTHSTHSKIGLYSVQRSIAAPASPEDRLHLFLAAPCRLEFDRDGHVEADEQADEAIQGVAARASGVDRGPPRSSRHGISRASLGLSGRPMLSQLPNPT